MLRIEDVKFLEDEFVKAEIYRYFFVDIPKEEMDALGRWEIKDGRLIITNLSLERSERKVMNLLRKYKRHLKYKLNGNPAIYVDEDLELPLIGLNFLGLVDKGSEIIEVKPITNCNADCSFCSVNEGPSSDKEVDFVLDLDYLISETENLLEYKKAENMELWINPHGEPTLYPKLTEYCEALLGNKWVKKIHIITNGMLLRKQLVDELERISLINDKEIGLSISMSGITQNEEEKSKYNKEGLSKDKLTMGKSYNLNLVIKNLEYAVLKLPITITPVLVAGMNDEQMEKIIEFAQHLSKNSKQAIEVMIQKFCKNKQGRNPAKEGSWDDFFGVLKKLEEDTGEKLTKVLGKIQMTPELPIPFQKKEMVVVKIICPSRYVKDRLGFVETPHGRRAICVLSCNSSKGEVKARIVQNKHNLLLAA